MTKTEYREYIASPDWQGRRKRFLTACNSCRRCLMPRWLAVIAYDQDLHVHHKSYANLGHEPPEDLEPLCRRCHEIESFGKSDLHEIKKSSCLGCGGPNFNRLSDYCVVCDTVFGTRYIESVDKNGHRIGQHLVLILAALSAQRGCPREDFFAAIEYLYELGVEAAPRISL